MFQDDFAGMEMCFLLDIDYLGKLYRFSTIPIDLEDQAELSTIRYEGGLEDPDINQSTSFLGTQVDTESVALEIIFVDIDWVTEWLQGRTLELAKAALYAIPISGEKRSAESV